MKWVFLALIINTSGDVAYHVELHEQLETCQIRQILAKPDKTTMPDKTMVAQVDTHCIPIKITQRGA